MLMNRDIFNKKTLKQKTTFYVREEIVLLSLSLSLSLSRSVCVCVQQVLYLTVALVDTAMPSTMY